MMQALAWLYHDCHFAAKRPGGPADGARVERAARNGPEGPNAQIQPSSRGAGACVEGPAAEGRGFARRAGGTERGSVRAPLRQKGPFFVLERNSRLSPLFAAFFRKWASSSFRIDVHGRLGSGLPDRPQKRTGEVRPRSTGRRLTLPRRDGSTSVHQKPRGRVTSRPPTTRDAPQGLAGANARTGAGTPRAHRGSKQVHFEPRQADRAADSRRRRGDRGVACRPRALTTTADEKPLPAALPNSSTSSPSWFDCRQADLGRLARALARGLQASRGICAGRRPAGSTPSASFARASSCNGARQDGGLRFFRKACRSGNVASRGVSGREVGAEVPHPCEGCHRGGHGRSATKKIFVVEEFG